MKTLKIISLLLLITTLLSCRNNETEPEVAEEPFDITKYVIVGSSKDLTAIHYILTFESQAEGVSMEYSALTGPQDTYIYKDGILKIFSPTGFNKKEFKIENGIIVSSSNSQKFNNTLVKIPATNQLSGNTYSGSWMKDGSTIMTFATLKFTNTHFSEASLNPPEPNTQYEIIKNIGALSIQADKRTLFVLVNGKLEGSRLSSGLGVSAGTFTKQ